MTAVGFAEGWVAAAVVVLPVSRAMARATRIARDAWRLLLSQVDETRRPESCAGSPPLSFSAVPRSCSSRSPRASEREH